MEELLKKKMQKLPKDYIGLDDPVSQLIESEEEKKGLFFDCSNLALELMGYGDILQKLRISGDINLLNEIPEEERKIAGEVCEGKISIMQLKDFIRKKKYLTKEKVKGKLQEVKITGMAMYAKKLPERYAVRVIGSIEEEIEREPYMKVAKIILNRIDCNEEQRKLISRILFQRYKQILPILSESEKSGILIRDLVDALTKTCKAQALRKKFQFPRECIDAMRLLYGFGFNAEEIQVLSAYSPKTPVFIFREKILML